MTSLPFNDALADLRVSGSVLLHDTYAEPWAISIPDEAELRDLTGAESGTRILPFHLVRDGAFALSQGDAAAVPVNTHEVAICAGGKAHVMSAGTVRKPVPFGDILKGRSPSAATAAAPSTSLLCGVFFLRAGPLNPMIAALPPFLKLDTSHSAGSPLLSGAVDMLRHEVGHNRPTSFTALRLLEVFCAEAIMAYRTAAGDEAANWFRALRDDRIARAMAVIHENPQADVSVARLAAACAMSPSRFAARFRMAMGQSVMSYVSQWRMNLACRLLREEDMGLADLAARVGYDDTAAFSRAFKSHLGSSPAQWRKLSRASGTTR